MATESTAPKRTYPDSVTDFFLENLPEELLRQFIVQKNLRIPAEAFPSFAARFDIPGALRIKTATQALLQFMHHLDTLMNEFSAGCFVRLGSRSPKDAGEILKPLHSAREVLMLFDRSDRINQDVTWCFLYEYAPVFWVRPWRNIPPWQEFRCIVKNGDLYGISQYHTQSFPSFIEINAQAKQIGNNLRNYMNERVIPFSIHKDFVCDVLYSNSSPMIIDYNPLTSGTGLGLFSARFCEPSFPEFRYVEGDNARAVPL